MGYDEQSNGLRFVDTTNNKVYISRDYKFVSVNAAIKLQDGCSSQVGNDYLEITIPSNRINDVRDKNVMDESDGDSFCSSNTDLEYFVDNVDNNEVDNEYAIDEPILRRSTRHNKGVPPAKYSNLVEADNFIEPKTYKQAVLSEQKLNWKSAMEEEINSLKANNTWELVRAPPDANIVGCKWTYKIKRDVDGKIRGFKARLVAQGFSQK